MTVEATNAFTGPYVANGLTTTFPFDFRAMTDAEIDVILDGAILSPSTYSVTITDSGGSVVFDAAPVGAALYIVSNPSFMQQVSFEDAGAFLPKAHDDALDRAAIRDAYLRDRSNRSIRAPIGETFAEDLPSAAARAGKFLGFTALGALAIMSGAGADAALRTDLAAVGGAALVQASTGESLEQVATRPHRLSFGIFKTRAYDRPTAISMGQDVTYLKGWAKNATTTGGAGKPVYWVTWSSDDVNTPGTFRYAMAQAAAGGGGQIFFEPRLEIDIILQSRIDIPSNVTIAAPGRNVRIRAKSNTQLMQISGATNVIIKFLDLSHLIDTTGINNKLNPGDPGYDAQQGGPANQADAITIIPTTADKIWIDQCTFQHISDGCIDVATSTLHVGAGTSCRVSISRCLFRDQYKTMLCGTSSTAAGDVDYTAARNVFVSYYENWYDHTAERHPRVSGLGYADSVNNIFDLASIQADDGVASGSIGIASYYGGWARSRGDLFRSLDGVATHALECSDGTSGIPESAAINENSVAEGALTFQTRNVATPTALPGANYNLVPAAVPAAGPAREAYRNAICAAAGARIEAMPRGNWTYSAASTQVINGVTVRAAPDKGLVGRYLLTDNQQELVPPPEALQGVTSTVWRRGSTKVLAADTITIDQTATVFTVTPEAGNTDNISTINGGIPDQVITLRPTSAAYTLTVTNAGNIDLGSRGSAIALTGSRDEITLRYDDAIGKWVIIAAPDQYGTLDAVTTGTLNVSAAGNAVGTWTRNGNVVTVAGTISITPTAAASADTTVQFPPPVASTFTAQTDAYGTSCSDDAVTQVVGSIKAVTANGKLQIRFKASTVSARTHSFVAQYVVK